MYTNVFVVLLIMTEIKGQDLISVEICEMKTFEAICSEQDEVIMIVEAQLGRMKKGKCMLEDFGYLNCSLDVKPEVDAFCSGRKECEVKVDDTTFIRTTPCHTDLKNHLIVTYKCIKVLYPDSRCSVVDFTHPSSFHPSGFIASSVVERTGCGLTNSPLTLRAGEGQRINLTLHDVTYKMMMMMMMIRTSKNQQVEGSIPNMFDGSKNFGINFIPVGTCRVYATVRDSDSQDLLGRGSSICGHQGSIVNAFTSTSNLIEIRFMGSHKVKDSERTSSSSSPPLTIDDILKSPQFLFQYSVTGCLESELPKEAWKRKSADGRSVVLGCAGSDVTWVMRCSGGAWEGSPKECNQGLFPLISGVSKVYTSLVVGSIAVTVSCFVLVFGVVCIRRNLKLRSNSRNMASVDEQYGLRSAGVKGEAKLHSASGHFVADDIYQDGNEYARMRLQMNQHQHASRDLLVRLADNSAPSVAGLHRVAGYEDQGEHIYESADTLKLQLEMCSAMSAYPVPQISSQEIKSSLHDRMAYESNKNLIAKPLPFPKPKEIIQNPPISYHLQTLDEAKQGNYSL